MRDRRVHLMATKIEIAGYSLLTLTATALVFMGFLIQPEPTHYYETTGFKLDISKVYFKYSS